MDATVIDTFRMVGLPLPQVKTWEGVRNWIVEATNEALRSFAHGPAVCLNGATAQVMAAEELARRDACVREIVRQCRMIRIEKRRESVVIRVMEQVE